MDFDELAKIIKDMSKIQRKTEVTVFEEGSRRYIWPARLVNADTSRPYLEGVASEGEEMPSKRELAQVRPHPNALQDPSVRGSVRAKPTELDSSKPVRRKPKKGDKTPK